MSKLIIRSRTEQHEKRPTRRGRHRYERPSTFVTNMHIKTQNNESHDNMYAKVLSDMLYFHNFYRAYHSASPLTISQRLNVIAQKYAEYLAARSKFEHSGNKLENEILGENLYMQWISHGRVPVSARDAVKSWYDEIVSYDFKNPRYSEETGHFTQMVWRSSQKMGVGVALSSDGREVYMVTNYYPAGNIINSGYFEKNVLPPTY